METFSLSSQIPISHQLTCSPKLLVIAGLLVILPKSTQHLLDRTLVFLTTLGASVCPSHFDLWVGARHLCFLCPQLCLSSHKVMVNLPPFCLRHRTRHGQGSSSSSAWSPFYGGGCSLDSCPQNPVCGGLGFFLATFLGSLAKLRGIHSLVWWT